MCRRWRQGNKCIGLSQVAITGQLLKGVEVYRALLSLWPYSQLSLAQKSLVHRWDFSEINSTLGMSSACWEIQAQASLCPGLPLPSRTSVTLASGLQEGHAAETKRSKPRRKARKIPIRWDTNGDCTEKKPRPGTLQTQKPLQKVHSTDWWCIASLCVPSDSPFSFRPNRQWVS